MRIGSAIRFLVAGAAVGLVLISALAATNTVSASKAGRSASAISIDDKKPKPACSGITVTTLITGGGDGGNSNDLVLGTAAANTMTGKNGDDCIVGGGGNDNLTGAGGTDVCIGGPGTDTFTTCETAIQ